MDDSCSVRMDTYKRLSRSVLELSRRIDFLQLLEPTNLMDEKIRFFSGRTHQPKFEYRPTSYSPEYLNKELSNLSFPSDPIGKLFERKVRDVWLSNQIVMNRGDRSKVRDFSIELYGAPDNKLVKKAISIAVAVNKDSRKDKSRLYCSTEVAQMTRKVLVKIGLRDWTVIRTRRQSSAVNIVKRQIKISMQKHYSLLEIKGIVAHEVFGHVYRAINGFCQPFKIFGTGLPGYLSTEEGLAMYLEEKYGVLDRYAFLRHALKVVAVDSILKNFCFEACFNRLVGLGADEDMAWELTSRVFRGGGFLKDHVYLKGYYEIKRYASDGGDIKKLFVGKIGLKDLAFCGDLYRRRLLKKPTHFPPKVLPEVCP